MTPGSPSFDCLRRSLDKLQDNTSLAYNSASLYTLIPSCFTWSDLASELARAEDQNKPQRLIALRACLEVKTNVLSLSKADAAPRRQIRRFVGRILTPVDDAEYDADVTHGGDNEERRNQVAKRCRTFAEDGLIVLERAGPPIFSGDEKDEEDEEDEEDEDAAQADAQIVHTITALADAGQPWTTDLAAEKAKQMLADYFGPGNTNKQQWIVDSILKQYLRPLFARARPAAVTASGRKAAYVSQDTDRGAIGTENGESPQAKPWKYVDLRAISVFAWAVHEATGELVRVHWPLFTPVLLALVDDPDTAVRARGLALLERFVATALDGGCPLHTTGLDSVLADAVFPTLHFLPRLTPEKESLQLLPPAYAALLGLVKAGAAAGSIKLGGGHSGKNLPQKPGRTLLDRMLREGIYSGYFYASEHIHIVEELMRQTGRIVEAMGVYAVKHLKDLMPIYAAILTDPFAMRYKPAVAATVDALQATMAACWPRIARTPWQEEIIKMLMLSWLHVVEDEEQEKASKANKTRVRTAKTEAKDLSMRLIHATDTLFAILKAAGVEIAPTIDVLVNSDSRLTALFLKNRAAQGRS
ncbi:hypothetical protein SEPCBS119000_006518 [Sporothrix epigloea]|uniref:tRNA nucleotidyltransferase n=1 Tax=Sporothrix epigloea TaxID=1892477 RepID=A0ABP0E3W8_9PEZI